MVCVIVLQKGQFVSSKSVSFRVIESRRYLEVALSVSRGSGSALDGSVVGGNSNTGHRGRGEEGYGGEGDEAEHVYEGFRGWSREVSGRYHCLY